MIIDLGKLEASDLSRTIFSVDKVFEELHRTQLQIDRTTLSSGGEVRADALHGYQRRLLGDFPPNLRDYCDHISSSDVFDFVERSGIPIYGVPRGEIAVQLIEADTIQKRRFLLNRYSSQILDDCETAIAAAKANSVAKLRPFVEEALEATRAGFTKAAQALFTTVLDTLLMNCWKTGMLNHSERALYDDLCVVLRLLGEERLESA